MELTREHIAKLAQRFPINEHEMRFGMGNKGYVTWLAYLTRPAVTRRIHDVLGFAVSDRIVSHGQSGKETYVIVEVSIGDIVHQSIGVDTDLMSAETRAYKRALTHLEVGLYLYECPTIQTRNTGYYDADTKRVTTWTDEYKQAQRDALAQLDAWLLGGEIHINDDPVLIGKTAWWGYLRNDADVLEYYNHEKHLVNALKQMDDVDMDTIPYAEIKQLLISRKAS